MKSSGETNWSQSLSCARDGDSLQLSRLLDFYRAYLTVLAKVQIDKQLLGGKVSESDLVQETLLRASQAFPDFRGKTEQELIAWLRKILARRITDVIRHFHADIRDIKLERRLQMDLDGSSMQLSRGLVANTNSPSEQLQQREEAVLLANALLQLSDSYREVIILRHFEDLTFPQIAERMGRSLNSVKNIWARAIAKLRTLTQTGMDEL